MLTPRSIVEYLELDEAQRPVTNLAMGYSYGLSIVSTHLLAGAALSTHRRSVLEQPRPQELVGRGQVTSLAGVPYCSGRACWRWAACAGPPLTQAGVTTAGDPSPGVCRLGGADGDGAFCHAARPRRPPL